MRSKFILACVGICAMISSSACAQTAPNFVSGQIPSVSDWNGYFAAKKDYFPVTTVEQSWSGLGLPNNTIVNGTSISLSAGTWIIFADAEFTAGSGTTPSGLICNFGNIPASTSSLYASVALQVDNFGEADVEEIPCGTALVTLSGTTIVYANQQSNWTGGSGVTGSGSITAVRLQ